MDGPLVLRFEVLVGGRCLEGETTYEWAGRQTLVIGHLIGKEFATNVDRDHELEVMAISSRICLMTGVGATLFERSIDRTVRIDLPDHGPAGRRADHVTLIDEHRLQRTRGTSKALEQVAALVLSRSEPRIRTSSDEKGLM